MLHMVFSLGSQLFKLMVQTDISKTFWTNLSDHHLPILTRSITDLEPPCW